MSQPIVENESGDRFRLDELLGPNMTIVTRNTELPEFRDDVQAVIDWACKHQLLSKASLTLGNFDAVVGSGKSWTTIWSHSGVEYFGISR